MPQSAPAVEHLAADYLVIGAGAMSMAFVDEIIHESPQSTVIVVERRATPGGHWNDAYDFVRLHQPALYYGVNSEPLGSGGSDLASKPELLDYYQRVRAKLEATGRAQFFFECDFQGDGRFVSLVDPSLIYQVDVGKRLVDGTYGKITVPATRPPKYAVSEGVNLVPINGLTHQARDWARYVVIGAGKTGIDAVLYLLSTGVGPERITWIVSRDAWLLSRALIQPDIMAYEMIAQLRGVIEETSARDVFLRSEREGRFLRLDPSIWPTVFRCATVSPEELEALRRIDHVVRRGRVQRIEPDRIVLDEGELATDVETLHVDCTADGLKRRPQVPVFAPGKITLQPVFLCQPTFSAAAIAATTLRFRDDQARNQRMVPAPHPERPWDYFGTSEVTIRNTAAWGLDLARRFRRSRLCFAFHFSRWALCVHVFHAARLRGRALVKMPGFAQQLRDEEGGAEPALARADGLVDAL